MFIKTFVNINSLWRNATIFIVIINITTIIIITIIIIIMMRVTSSRGAVIPRGKAFSRGWSSQSIVTYNSNTIAVELKYNCNTIAVEL